MTVMTASVGEHQTGWVADDSTFGARLALIRQRMGWGNIKEASTACGLPAESWRRWERDGRAPRDVVQIAGVISDRTGCDFGWLLAGSRLRSRDDRYLHISHVHVSRYDNAGPLRRVPTQRRSPPRGPGNTRPGGSRPDSSRRATAIPR